MEIKKSDFFLIPNLLTVLRFLTYPFIYYFLKKEELFLAFVFIVIAALTDVLDGLLARKLNQASDLGKILDPFVDKLGVGIFIIYAAVYKGFPIWASVVVIAKEILFLVAGLFIIGKKSIVPVSSFWGKLNACVWSFTVFCYLFELDYIKNIFLGIALAVALVTVIAYSKMFVKYMGKTPVSSSNPGNPDS
jgi:cardiolipin synthase